MEAGKVEELYVRDVAEAWRRYLSDTRELVRPEYEHAEPHIWRRLSDHLAAARQLRQRRLDNV